MDEALALYRDALQLPLVKEGTVPERGVHASVLAAGGSYLEVLQPFKGESDSPFRTHIDEEGEGLHHLALWSDNVESDVARLLEAQTPLADDHPREGFTGRLSYLMPAAFDGVLLEVVEPEELLNGRAPAGAGGPWQISRIDHVVLRVPDAQKVCDRFQQLLGVSTKRTFERGGMRFAFMRPGDVVIEVIGPLEGAEPGTGRIAGLAFEVKGIDVLASSLKATGYPVGEPHPALQGGRIVSVHHSGACGVPLAFIDFTDSPRP